MGCRALQFRISAVQGEFSRVHQRGEPDLKIAFTHPINHFIAELVCKAGPAGFFFFSLANTQIATAASDSLYEGKTSLCLGKQVNTWCDPLQKELGKITVFSYMPGLRVGKKGMI